MLKYDIHEDFQKMNYTIPVSGTMFAISHLPLKIMLSCTKVPSTIMVQKFKVKGYRGKPVSLEMYSPRNLAPDMPAMVYFHGGAFGFKASPAHKKLACIYAERANCRVIFPDYHLLPNYPYPVAKEDVYAVYQLAIEKSDELAINPQKVAIGGDSAGGTLATYVCKLADENHIQLPCFQMLIYPAVDATMQTKSMKNFTDTPIWNSKENKKYGGCICKTVKD